MTCHELGGACEEKFSADTFEEIAKLSQTHGMEMFQKNDPEHLEAMGKMKDMMKDEAAMQTWYDGKKREFETKPEN